MSDEHNVRIPNCIRVTRIDLKITRADLHGVFSCFGPITAINIKRNRYNHRNGTAFINFCHPIYAQFALEYPIPIFIKGCKICVLEARQNHISVDCNDETTRNQTSLSKNEKDAVDSNVPLTAKSSVTSCTCSTIKTCSTCSIIKKKSPKFNLRGLPRLSNVFHSAAQGFYYNQHQQNLSYLNWHESENFTTNYQNYYEVNQMIYRPILQYASVPNFAACNYSYGNNQYYLPQENTNYTSFYDNNYMYPNSSHQSNQFYCLNSPIYEYTANVYNNEALNSQPLASQSMSSPVHVVYKNQNYDRYASQGKIIDISDQQKSPQAVTFVNNVKDLLDNDIPKDPYFGSYLKYAESFVENLRQLDAFQEQFCDAPFEFLQPEEDDNPSEYSKVLSRFSNRNLKRFTDESSETDSDDGITVEIEQFTDYDKYLKIARRNSWDYNLPNPLRLLKTTDKVIDHCTSLIGEITILDKSEVISHSNKSEEMEPNVADYNLPNSLNLLEATEEVIDQCTSLIEEISFSDKHEEISHSNKSEEMEPKVPDYNLPNSLNLPEATEKVIDQCTSLIEEIRLSDKHEEISHSNKSEEMEPEVPDYNLSIPIKLLKTTDKVIDDCTSLIEKISLFDNSEELSYLEKAKEMSHSSKSKETCNLDKSKEMESKAPNETQEIDPINQVPIGYYVVRVRDVATQFPEFRVDLSDTSDEAVDEEPNSVNIATQTFRKSKKKARKNKAPSSTDAKAPRKPKTALLKKKSKK